MKLQDVQSEYDDAKADWKEEKKTLQSDHRRELKTPSRSPSRSHHHHRR
jgi:hypothetical protein